MSFVRGGLPCDKEVGAERLKTEFWVDSENGADCFGGGGGGDEAEKSKMLVRSAVAFG